MIQNSSYIKNSLYRWEKNKYYFIILQDTIIELSYY